jgi:valyl-tRNA synthetase
MSKSLGNSPDLLELIEKYGADAVRFGIMVSSPAGNDLLFDETSCEQGRNFANKIWNALRLIKGWKVEELPQFISSKTETEMVSEGTHLGNSEASQFAIEWMEQRINVVSSDYHKLIAEYKLSEALRALYSLIWDDFCAWYLEMIKPEFVDGVSKPIDKKTLDATINFFEQLMHLLHPFMPFCTEEFYAVVKERNESDVLVTKQFDKDLMYPIDSSNLILQSAELLKQVVSTIRDVRNKNQLKPKDKLKLMIETIDKSSFEVIQSTISKLANLSEIKFNETKTSNSIHFVVGNNKCYLNAGSLINTDSQKEDLEKELDYLVGFLKSVQAKLSNEKFVANAKPEVLALEQKKKSDAESRMNAVKESLLGLN